jgi:hypothetical protein
VLAQDRYLIYIFKNITQRIHHQNKGKMLTVQLGLPFAFPFLSADLHTKNTRFDYSYFE